LLTRIGPNERAVPKPAFELTPKKLEVNKGAAGNKLGSKEAANKKTGAKLNLAKAASSFTSASAGEKKPTAPKALTPTSQKKKGLQVTPARLRADRKKHPVKALGAGAKAPASTGQKPSPGIAKTPASEEPSD
jgi:hypothetical protein